MLDKLLIKYDRNLNRIEIFNVTTDVTLCFCGRGCRRFEETSAFILKQWSHLRGLCDPHRWRHYIPSQPRKPLAKRHGVISQKTWILSNTSGKKNLKSSKATRFIWRALSHHIQMQGDKACVPLGKVNLTIGQLMNLIYDEQPWTKECY